MDRQESMMYQNIVHEIVPDIIPGAKIKVLWIGWCWNKALNRMIQDWLEGVEFVAINTDAQDLAVSLAQTKVNIGLNITKWLWAGANPEVGRKAAEESEAEIKEALRDTDMVFLTAGMGGWTWTGAAAVIANIAKSMGILTIAIVTKPFWFEGKKREINWDEWLAKLKDSVDTLIVIPNDKIFSIVDKKTTFQQAFKMIDKILHLGVQGISDLIVKPWDINIDFADIREVMSNSGNALLGIWYWVGEKRAVDAARKAIENPLLETNLDGAKKVIFAVSGGYDLTPMEVREAASVVEEILSDEVNMIWWMSFDDSFDDEVRVTLIATGFDVQAKDNFHKNQKNRDIFGQKKVSENGFTRVLQWAGQSSEMPAYESKQQAVVQEETYSKPVFQLRQEEDLEDTPAFMTKRLNHE